MRFLFLWILPVSSVFCAFLSNQIRQIAQIPHSFRHTFRFLWYFRNDSYIYYFLHTAFWVTNAHPKSRSGLAPPLGELARLVRLAPHHTAGYAGRAFLTRPAERFERNGFDNLSVICFANATVSLRLSHGAGLTAHRAVIQHRAAASLPYTGEASRCGGDCRACPYQYKLRPAASAAGRSCLSFISG